MKNSLVLSVCAALLSLANTGCRTFILHRVESDVRSGAVLHVEKLKDKGALPGFTSDEHCEIILRDAMAVLRHSAVQYPFELIFHARKSNDPEKAVYVYRLVKHDPDLEWRLIGACKRVAGKNIWYKDMQEDPQQSPAP